MHSFARPAWLLFVAGFASTIGCARDDDQATASPTRSSAAIDAASVRLLDLDGQPFDLVSAEQGRIRVVIFTRSDCPISNRYAPDVRRLYETFQPRDADFYLIYVDPSEKPDAIRAHLQEFDYPCPALRDPEHTLVAYTHATVTPEAVVFDGEGHITYRGRIDNRNAALGNAHDSATKNDLNDAIEATLNGQPVAEPVTTAVGCNIADLKVESR